MATSRPKKQKPIQYSEVARLEARIALVVKERIELAASIQGRTVTDFLVSAADEQARKVIQEHQIITLSKANSLAFANVLLNPPEPNKKARDAAKWYKKKMGY